MFSVKFLIVLMSAMILLCSCSAKTEEKAAAKTETASSQTETAEQVQSAPDGDYIELGDGSMAELDSVTKAADKLFPKLSGRKLYGYTGLFDIGTDSGVKSCHVFEFYTCKTKAGAYNKIATLAKADGSAEIYMLDEVSGEYKQVEDN